MVKDFPKLFERGKIGKMALKNRIVMCPMGTFSENMDGSVSSNQLEYYPVDLPVHLSRPLLHGRLGRKDQRDL